MFLCDREWDNTVSYRFQEELELGPIENYVKARITFEETGVSPSVLLKANFHLVSLERWVLQIFFYNIEPYTIIYIIFYISASGCQVSLSWIDLQFLWALPLISVSFALISSTTDSKEPGLTDKPRKYFIYHAPFIEHFAHVQRLWSYHKPGRFWPASSYFALWQAYKLGHGALTSYASSEEPCQAHLGGRAERGW